MTDPLVDRVPPHSLEAEMAVLGAMMQSADATSLCMEHLDADCFYRPEHGALFSALAAMFDASHAVDWITLKEELAQRGDLESVGGGDYLITLVDCVPTIANAEYYARIVLLNAKLRQIIQAGAEMIRDAHDPRKEPEAIIDSVEERIFAIAERGESGSAVHIGRVLHDLGQSLKTGGALDRGIETGFRDLDDALRGLHGGQLILLAARPSVGKTSMAVSIGLHAAKTAPVLLFSLEMVATELALRVLAKQSSVSAWVLRGDNLGAQTIQAAAQAAEDAADTALYVDASAALTINEIRGRTRRLIARKGIGLVIVDYLQLVHGIRRRGTSREQEVASVSRGLKRLARECAIPLLALAQLRRLPPGSKAKPQLSDLRESGSLEQDADVVLLLHRENIYQGAEAELRIAKQRHGPAKVIKLTWCPARVCFADRVRPFMPEAEPLLGPHEEGMPY